MGLNVSQPRGTKFKYVHASNYEDRRRNSEENEEFLSGSSKREKAGFFQFKSRNGKANCTFDSLDTINSRKSVPFAALPDTTRASTSSPSGDKEDLHSIFSDEETTTNASCKNSVVHGWSAHGGHGTRRSFQWKLCRRILRQDKTELKTTLRRETFLPKTLFIYAQFLITLIKDSLLKRFSVSKYFIADTAFFRAVEA